MTNRWMVLMAIAAALVAVDPVPAAAQQVQVTGPLAGEPAVRHMRLYRTGRVRLAPVVSFTLQDEFSKTIFVGAEIGYSFVDWLGVSVWGAYGVAHINTDLTKQIEAKGQTRSRNALSLPSPGNFSEQVGQLDWAAALQLNFIPLRGKMSLFQKVFIDTDFYLFAGAALVGITERSDVTGTDASACNDIPVTQDCLATQTADSSRLAIAPTFGVGLDFFANDFIAVKLEWRGMPFSWNTSGFDVLGGDADTPDQQVNSTDRVFHFNHMVTLGVSVFLPTETKVSD